MSLTTSRLILRPWREQDLTAFARLNDDPVVMEFLPRRLSRDERDAYAARIRTNMEKRGWGFWAVEVRRNWLAPREGTLGIRLGNRGGCREAVAASLRCAFEKLTFQQIVALTVPLNKRSIRVMERIGMSRDLRTTSSTRNFRPTIRCGPMCSTGSIAPTGSNAKSELTRAGARVCSLRRATYLIQHAAASRTCR
jgi:RimJ/RimL family protein N-acetyltransferase